MSENEQDDAQKTEDPTPKKLEEARKKGQVAISREVNNWIMLLAGTFIIALSVPGMMLDLKVYMRTYIEQAHLLPEAPGGMRDLLSGMFMEMFSLLMLPFIVLMCAAVIGPLVQVGPLFSAETIKPAMSKVSPVAGFKRLFSMRSLIEFIKGLLKLGLVSLVGVLLLIPFYGSVEHFVGLPLEQVLYEMQKLIMRFLIGTLIVLLIIAMIDLVYQRVEHSKKMRMTKQEVRDEYRQSEGDPHIRAKLRQLRSERARQRMMQNVPQADVIITNPTHFAIALKYKPDEMDAPVCVAKGQDEVALRIREVAKEHNIIIYEDKPLARALYDVVEVDQMIPPNQYQAVAKIISFVFKQRGRL